MTPHSSATSSWPKSGGNDITTRIATGISHPAGRSRTFSEKGRSFYEERVSRRVEDAGDAERERERETHLDCLVVVERQEDGCD
jgi:hypothetical protein